MATTTAFNSLLAPAPDDTMQISSPANRDLDDEIEIDFDDYTGGVDVVHDEQMIEDADPARPNTSTDDLMEDDILPGEQALVEEEVMQDDGVQIQELPPEDDEELIDYGEDEIHDEAVEDTVIPEEIEEPEEATEDANENTDETADEDASRAPGFAIPSVPPPGLVEDHPARDVQFPNPQGILEDLLESTASLENGAPTEADAAFADELQAHANPGPAGISIDTASSAQVETPGTPTDTGLHPMTIRYGDLRMPLFKSRRQTDGLLKDDNLASLSLAELIKNCRQRLAIKIGEDISEDQDLVLSFEGLGLMLVEDSRAAFESSLNDILEVYLQLHRNDATPDIPALSLALTLQMKFASTLSVLKNAAAGGQGISAFGWLQPLAEEELYHEEYDDDQGTGVYTGEAAEYPADGESHVDATNQHDASGTNHQDFAPEDEGLDRFTEDAGEHFPEEHYENEEYYYEDTSAGPHDNLDPAPPGLEELLQGEHHLTDTINNTLDKTATTGKDVVSDNTAVHLDAALGEKNEEPSRESSTTEQGDTNAGEYDFIDFDDDTLTSELSAQTSDGHDDFSTFLTEFEAKERAATHTKEDRIHSAPDLGAQYVPELPEGEQSSQTLDAHHLGSEDFLNDLGEHSYEGQDFVDEQGANNHYQPGDGQEQEQYGEEEYYDQADTYGEQQYDEEYHPDYQPGDEADEQFHTAQQDFFQDEFYQHGPEHDVHNDEAEEEGLDDTVNTVVHHQIDEEEYQEDFEDDIGFDDDTFEGPQDDGEAVRPAISGSPLGNKRSFDDLADEDDLDFEERDVKKSRAS